MTTLPKTAEQIREMPAGAEMDSLIAKLIMGYPYTTKPNSYIAGVINVLGQPICDVVNVGHGCDVFNEVVFRPSTDIAHAWEVAEKIGRIAIRETPSGLSMWMAGFPGSEGLEYIWADTAPLAICRAALLSVAKS